MEEVRRVRSVVSRDGVGGASVMLVRSVLRVVRKVVVRAVVWGSRVGVERRSRERVVERHWFMASSGPRYC
jgi:hypothetical protein